MPGHFLDDYEPVEDRIRAFWTDHPDGSITTRLLYHDDKRYIVSSQVFSGGANHDRKLLATGLAEETVGSSPVNRTSALENCETSAIGRALANAGYAPKGKRPSREEMEKVQRVTRAAEARDELHIVCERLKLDKYKVAAAYQRIYHLDVRDDDDADRIRVFIENLQHDQGDMLQEEVKE